MVADEEVPVEGGASKKKMIFCVQPFGLDMASASLLCIHSRDKEWAEKKVHCLGKCTH
jgi:hypothetical protein